MTKEKLKKQRFVESNSRRKTEKLETSAEPEASRSDTWWDRYKVNISVGWGVLSEQEHECEDEISQICGRKCDMTSDRPGVTVERGRGGDGKEGRKVQEEEELENGEWCYRKHREEENEERVWEVSGGRGGNWESDGGWRKKGREKREQWKEKRWTIT